MNVRRWIAAAGALVLTVGCAHTGPQAAQVVRIDPGKKVIEWGWDEPNPAFMRAQAASMDSSGFDGVIFHAEPQPDGKPCNFAWECWGARRFALADFAGNIADLKAVHGSVQKLTENFLRFNVCPGGVDWFDDGAFAVVLHNAEVAGQVARAGGCRGLMFDIEMYQDPLFTYSKQPHKDSRSLAEYGAKVRERGQALMQAFSRHYPDITVLLTYGYGITGLGGDRSKAPYGLLKDLLDGLFDGAVAGATLVDAFEGAYSFRTHREFVNARETVLQTLPRQTGNPRQYRRHVRLGFGIWMDNRYGAKAWHTDDLEQNYFTPEEFEYAVFCALDVADRYVWVYTEHPKWWTNEQLPPAYREALQRVRTPRVVDDERATARLAKGGGPQRPVPEAATQPGYGDDDTFSALRATHDIVADLPRTWRFRADPEKHGHRADWQKPGPEVGEWRDLEIGKFWDEQGVRCIGQAWYRLVWDAPALTLPKGGRLVLCFGAVDELATVWVNGKKVGGHYEPPDTGWDKPFTVDVTSSFRPGQPNTIAVRVDNGALAGGIWKPVKLAAAKPGTPTAGPGK
jgi:hypothetical protein